MPSPTRARMYPNDDDYELEARRLEAAFKEAAAADSDWPLDPVDGARADLEYHRRMPSPTRARMFSSDDEYELQTQRLEAAFKEALCEKERAREAAAAAAPEPDLSMEVQDQVKRCLS